jgi:coatomer subunit gamma
LSEERLQVLENVSVEIDLAELEDVTLVEDAGIPLKRMPHNSAGSTFVVMSREDGSMARGSAVAVMKFIVKEVDPSTGEVEEDGYEDEYQLEDLEACLSTTPALSYATAFVWDHPFWMVRPISC